MKNGPSSVKDVLPLRRKVRSKGKTLTDEFKVDFAAKGVDTDDFDAD